MAFKAAREWIGPSGQVSDSITGPGDWTLNPPMWLRSDVDTAVFFSSVDADASGVTVSVGIRTINGKTPVPVDNGSKTLAGMDVGQECLDAMFQPKGDIVLTVGEDFVEEFIAQVVQ